MGEWLVSPAGHAVALAVMIVTGLALPLLVLWAVWRMRRTTKSDGRL